MDFNQKEKNEYKEGRFSAGGGAAWLKAMYDTTE
jgi:hypothetical protein